MPIPQSAKYVPVSLKFTALFNTPLVGGYSFETSVNKGIELLKFQQNAWYFLDIISVGGTISELDYCNSIRDIPTLILRKAITGERVYTRPLTIPKYSETRELSVFCNSDKGYASAAQDNSDRLVADLDGSLNQIAATVGLSEISLLMSIAIFQMDEAGYNEAMRQPLTKEFSQKLR
jgi:hypothetical protein